MIVYKSTNIINGKVYIGITIRGFLQRKHEHLKYAFKYNSELMFHKALRKYGEENFTWEIIDFANSIEELYGKEIYWIKYFNSCKSANKSNGYNMTSGGEGFKGLELPNIVKDGVNKGSKNPRAKINEEDVLKIKDLLKNGRLTQKEIARKFNVSIDIISCIKTGKAWHHVGEDLSNIKYWNSKKLTANDVVKIKELIKLKTPYYIIKKEFNIAKTTIDKIRNGEIWVSVGEDINYIIDNNRNAKLKEDDVKEIKLLLKDGKLKVQEIANKFKVAYNTIYYIKTGKTWSNVLI